MLQDLSYWKRINPSIRGTSPNTYGAELTTQAGYTSTNTRTVSTANRFPEKEAHANTHH